MATLPPCRACLSTNLYMFLPLGDHPPANSFLKPEQLGKPEPKFPLDTIACLNCGLVLVIDQLPADFFTEYVYMPGASDTMRAHFGEMANTLRDRFIKPGQRVVDIGCNDGLFLKHCKDIGVETLGIEPAANIAEIARAKGIEVLNEYFTRDSAARIRKDHGPAQVIVTTNTFNHIDNLHGFMQGVDALLAPDGTFVVEVPQALDYVQKNEFDTVYHEHLSTFSVTSLVKLFAFFGLQVVEVQRLPIHGGSMRVFGQRRSPASTGEAPQVQQLLDQERDAGLFERATYDAFSERIARIRSELMTMLKDLKAAGKRLAGYGAPAKGSTLLNYYGIGPDLLDFLADRNPLKQGRWSPGMHIPVVSPERIREAKPDYLLILAWNFADEIMGQQEEFRAAGGKFIIPIPEPRIVG